MFRRQLFIVVLQLQHDLLVVGQVAVPNAGQHTATLTTLNLHLGRGERAWWEEDVRSIIIIIIISSSSSSHPLHIISHTS